MHHVLSTPWVVYLIRVLFKMTHIGLIPELASHLNIIEEIYGGSKWLLFMVVMLYQRIISLLITLSEIFY